MAEEFWMKYRDPRWQQMRLKIMERDKWKCKWCGTNTETLNVHHAYYDRDTDPWDYPEEVLVTFCEACHKRNHDLKRAILLMLAHVGIYGAQEIVGYACAMGAMRANFEFTVSEFTVSGIASYLASGFSQTEWQDAVEPLVGKRIGRKDLFKAENDAIDAQIAADGSNCLQEPN